MVLCWRRYGRAGGCQIKWGRSSVGRAPALQAGGQEFESLRLHWIPEKGSKDKNPYLENRILKIILKYQRLKSWFVRTNRIEEDKREDIQNKQKRNEDFK